jgi:hypothetical protein
LRKLPFLSLENQNAIDLGGVLRDRINQLFQKLLNSDLFMEEPTRPLIRTFNRPSSYTAYSSIRSKYVVFGKLFFWFVIIHQQIPYPNNIDPVIISLAIYDTISVDLIKQNYPSIGSFAQMILDMDVNISATIEIPQDIQTWISASGCTSGEFLRALQNPDLGPKFLVHKLCIPMILGNAVAPMREFRTGFISDREHDSVLLSFVDYD